MFLSGRACLLLLCFLGAESTGDSVSLSSGALSTAFDEDRMRSFAELAGVAYCQPSLIDDWTCRNCGQSGFEVESGKVRVMDNKSFWQENSTRVVVGKLKDVNSCFVSFRGSSDTANWISDFLALQIGAPDEPFPGCTGCYVHLGFWQVWEAHVAGVKSALLDYGCGPTSSNGVMVMGHSMGAAVAHLAMYTLHQLGFHITEAYTFESPRVGNQAYVDAFEDLFLDRIPMYRMTHNRDIVVHVPMSWLGYVHVRQEVFYNETTSGVEFHKICDDASQEDVTCSWQYLWDNLDTYDHCNLPWVQAGNICNCSHPAGDVLV